jgi:hypothetical protein
METLENKVIQQNQKSQADGQAETVVIEPTALRPTWERFAAGYMAHGNAARAYRDAFDVSPDMMRPTTVAQRAYELRQRPEVAERIRQLQAAAAEGATISVRARMAWLEDIRTADPSEIIRIVAEPCSSCWPDAAQDAPRADCAACRGEGITRVKVTPTELLSSSARKLIRSVRQKASGEIEVRLHDQLEAADQLNRLQGAYVERSVSLNINADLKPLKRGMSVEEALQIMESIAPTQAPATQAPAIDAEFSEVSPQP